MFEIPKTWDSSDPVITLRKHARGEFVFFLNNDTQVSAGWLDSLVAVFDQHQDAGIVGSRLLFPDGKLQEAGGIVWDDGSGWNFGRLDDPEKPEFNYLKEVDYVSGAALMIRSSLLTELDRFDERFVPAYYEDTDLAFAVRDAGFKVFMQPRSKYRPFRRSHQRDRNRQRHQTLSGREPGQIS